MIKKEEPTCKNFYFSSTYIAQVCGFLIRKSKKSVKFYDQSKYGRENSSKKDTPHSELRFKTELNHKTSNSGHTNFFHIIESTNTVRPAQEWMLIQEPRS